MIFELFYYIKKQKFCQSIKFYRTNMYKFNSNMGVSPRSKVFFSENADSIHQRKQASPKNLFRKPFIDKSVNQSTHIEKSLKNEVKKEVTPQIKSPELSKQFQDENLDIEEFISHIDPEEDYYIIQEDLTNSLGEMLKFIKESTYSYETPVGSPVKDLKEYELHEIEDDFTKLPNIFQVNEPLLDDSFEVDIPSNDSIDELDFSF